MAMTDSDYMLLAAAEARKGFGQTSPNPLVGALLVKADRIVGRGYHRRAGEAHAEINALRDAGNEAAGATLYVTLEPCSTCGRTPACTEAIKAAGLRKVVIGAMDPNPKHAGRGLEILREAGIEVVAGVEQAACDELNRAFYRWIVTGRPYVMLKMAMTLDGKIATAGGESQWITGPAARQRVQELRRWADAIMVSGATVRLDHPQLTVREPADWPCQPLRVIASRHFPEDELRQYFPAGPLPWVVCLGDGDSWLEFLSRLGERNVTALLLEGGGELAAAALQHQVVDEVEFHIAPKLLCGRGSRPVTGGDNPLHLSEALELLEPTVSRYGGDFVFNGRLRPPGGGDKEASCSLV
ncbi:bifunctional diaminohydroxyphosphoribosylaminopyrimidine deaminase/5-amino-6-(5-phosphoribosylamino)uracil reductase RibD [Victivallis sp. Marseille-Q1083]|uniref:bifunctional diaminohydroxyphosphoribosylaminopyrimidine deaminase/5-amino-6-(5-phosphoribosylamino)uracil reductase RibD n=1 Tax=Victivallis sp. Marseille-Q1083 TaxID=2717288 RepID=UPI001C378BBA|nr:bifunctional diaminohydroxyphosphoribosylaminopyrimidine deaminase/5-amino-6-(5-phosphoribosylamino)uracil reductase RibD [Victivallis sp. Marseille-Q1083]